MHFVVFATHRQELGQQRARLADAFGDYVHNPTHHPDVVVHHGGPTISESDGTVTGLLLVLESPSREAAQAFVAESPYAREGIFSECHVRAWNWLTGRPS